MKRIALLFVFAICFVDAMAQSDGVVTKRVGESYESVGEYSDSGLALVKLRGKYGFIDEEGREVIPLQFDEVGVEMWERCATYISVRLNGKWGMIDREGKMVLNPVYDKIRSYLFEDETLVCASKDGKYGCVDIGGKVLVPFEYKELQNGFFYDQPAFARKGNKYGFIDRNNNIVAPFKYSTARPLGLVTELAPVSVNGKYGYIDKTGREVIPLQYDFADDFCSGVAAVVKNGKVGFIDESGAVVLPFQYDAEYSSDEMGKILKGSYFFNDVGVVLKGGKRGIIDRQGNTVVPFDYDKGTIDLYTIELEKDGKTYYFDVSGMQYSSEEDIDLNSTSNLAVKGNKYAMYYYAMNYIDDDVEKFKYWIEKASNAGHRMAQIILGEMYLWGDDGIEKSEKTAYELFLKATDKYGDAKFNESSIYYYAMGGNYISDLSIYDMVKISIENRFAGIGQAHIGSMYYYGSEATPQSYETAYEWYLKAAANNNRVAQEKLGYMFIFGQGVERSVDNAIKWYLKAGYNGNSNAQCMLGIMYEGGFGGHVQQSYEDAIYWYTRAAENGDGDALLYLGELYYEGNGVEQSYKTAFEYFSEYAKTNEDDTDLQRYLGIMYYNGWGVDRSYENAYKWLTKAAESGDAESQYYLGQMYNFGYYVESSIEKAVELYRAAMAGGEIKAKYMLAIRYLNDQGAYRNDRIGLNMLLELADEQNNYAPAQYKLGSMYQYPGNIVAQSNERAIYWLSKAAENGYNDAKSELGYIYYRGLLGVEQSYEKAFEWFSGCNDCHSQCEIGIMYYNGYGVPQSYEKAYEWFIKSYEGGLVGGEHCHYLGLMYYNGYGVPQSYEKAYEWFSRSTGFESRYYIGRMYENGIYVKQSYATAAEYYNYGSTYNYAPAQTQLAYLYFNGLGVPQSYATAFDLFLRAASQGNNIAQYNLGVMWGNGMGTQKSDETAFAWYLRSANNNYEPAQYQVALMYEQGIGTRVSLADAKNWYSKSAAQGNLIAKERLEVLSDYKMPQKPALATMTWVGFEPNSQSRDYTFKVGINSNTKIEAVEVYVNGAVTRGINTVVSDNYDMTITRNVILANGQNTIRVVVKNAAGQAYTEKTVSFQDKSAPVIDWYVENSITKDRQFTIRAGIKSSSKIESYNIYVNNQQDRGIQAVRNDGYAMTIERTVALAEGENVIKIEVRNAAGATNQAIKHITYNAERRNVMFGERRIALVIGNGNYAQADKLKNPANDVVAVAAKLRKLGFYVMQATDMSRQDMVKSISAFGTKIEKEKYDVALFYYAGHGMNVNGANYMIPVDADIENEFQIKTMGVDMTDILMEMERAKCQMKIVVLDACRNNPFTRSWKTRGVPSANYEIQTINAPRGTLIAYSTSQGDVAEDGKNTNNSPYTSSFVETLDIKGLAIGDFFDMVGVLTEQKTNNRQTPWTTSSFRGQFIFNPEL